MFHCHNLIHEDNLMLDAFNATLLEELGYKFEKTQDFSNPLDPRYRPQPSSASDYEESSIRSTLSALGNLGAYKNAAEIAKAESDFYATAGYPTESDSPATATEAPATVSGAPTSGAYSESATPGPPTKLPHQSYTGLYHGRPSSPPAVNTKKTGL